MSWWDCGTKTAAGRNCLWVTNADKEREIVPTYDVKELDKDITRIAREMRLLDTAIKAANATTKLNYEWDDAVLGEVK